MSDSVGDINLLWLYPLRKQTRRVNLVANQNNFVVRSVFEPT